MSQTTQNNLSTLTTMEDHNSIQNPTLPPSNHTQIMKKLKQLVFTLANSHHSNTPLSPSQIVLIEQQLLIAFPVFHTPTHPTYSAMIQCAIKNLRDEDGSNEEAISKYIKENYDGLPWAHNMYLSYHLHNLCENGEIVSTSSNCYSTPALIQEFNLEKKKQPKRRLRRKGKEDELDSKGEEGNLGGEKVVEVSRSLDRLQDDDILVFRRSRVKRRRSRVVFVEEDDEVVDKEEKSSTSSSQKLVVERCNDALVAGDLTGKTSGLTSGLTEDHDLVNVDEEDKRKLLFTECQYEVKTSVPLLDDDDACQGKTELDLPLVSMHDDSDAAKLIAVPVECVEKSSLNTDSVSSIWRDDSELAVKDSAWKESELMIVPYEGNTSIFGVSGPKNLISERIDPIIICGLPFTTLEEPKRKKQVHSPRKRLKACHKGTDVSLKSLPSVPALAMGHNQRGLQTKLKICGPRRNFFQDPPLDPLRCPMSLEEFISVEDEEHMPLKKVFQKFGRRKKHAVRVLSTKAPSATEASSKSGSNIQRVLQTQDQKHCEFEADIAAVTGSKTLALLHMENGINRPRQMDQEPHISVEDSTTVFVDILHQHRQQGLAQDQERSMHFKLTAETLPSNEESHSGEDNRRTRGDHDLPEPEQSTEANIVESSPAQHLNGQKEPETIAVMEEKAPIGNEQCETMQKTKPKRQGSERPKAMSSMDGLFEERTPSHCRDIITGQEREGLWQVNPNGPEIGPAESNKHIVSTLDHFSQQLTNQPNQQSWKSNFNQKEVKEPSDPATNWAVEETSSILCQIGHVASKALQSKQEEHQKQPIIKSPFSEASLQSPKHQIEDQEGKSQNDVKFRDQESTIATCVEEHAPSFSEKGEQEIKQVNRELRKRPQKQLEVSKEVVVSSTNEHLQQQEGPKHATHKNLKQQNKQQKREGRGRPQKEKGAIKEEVESLNMHPQLRELSEQLTAQHSQQLNKQLQNVGRERTLKQMKAAKENAIALPNLHLQQGLSEAAIDHHSQMQIKQIQGRSCKLIEATEEDRPPLYVQPQEGLSELATDQHPLQKFHLKKNKCRGRPRKQANLAKENAEASSTDQHSQPQNQLEGTKKDAASSLILHDQQRMKSSKPATDNRKGRRGRPRKHKDATALVNAPHGEQEWHSETATDLYNQQQNKQLIKDSRERPWEHLDKENSEASLTLLHELEEGRSDQEKEHKVDDFPDVKPEQSQTEVRKPNLSYKMRLRKSIGAPVPSDNESHAQEREYKQDDGPDAEPEKPEKVHKTPATGQAMLPSDDDTHQYQKKQILHSAGHLPKTGSLSNPSVGQPDQQQEEQNCCGQEAKQGKLEGQARSLKEKLAKSKVIHVPLSSKDHLRSRVKRRSQDST